MFITQLLSLKAIASLEAIKGTKPIKIYTLEYVDKQTDSACFPGGLVRNGVLVKLILQL